MGSCVRKWRRRGDYRRTEMGKLSKIIEGRVDMYYHDALPPHPTSKYYQTNGLNRAKLQVSVSQCSQAVIQLVCQSVGQSVGAEGRNQPQHHSSVFVEEPLCGGHRE